MANQTHIEWLLEGVSAWNARRAQGNFQPDFEEADISGEFGKRGKLGDDGRVCLRGINLRGADLRKADLHRADLHKADLRKADLHSADLGKADLSFANLTNANLTETILIEANLVWANLSYSRVWKAKLYGCITE